MKITHQHHFDANLAAVVEMFASQEFARARGNASGSDDSDVVLDGDATTSFTVSIRRTVPSESIPAEFRSMVGNNLSIRYTEAWEDPEEDQRVGTFAVEIVGAPGHVAGAIGLTAVKTGTDLLLTGEVNAKVPLFGAMIEEAVGSAVIKVLEGELETADEWLARQ